MFRLLNLTAIPTAMLLLAPACFADIIGITSSTGGSADPNSGVTLGFEFTPNTDIMVTQLGVFDVGGDGLTESHDVGIWLATGGAPLATDTVVSADPLDTSGYRFSALSTPLSLVSGTAYRVGAYYSSANDKLQNTAIIADPLISIADINGTGASPTRSNTGGSLAFPEAINSLQRTNANFQFVAVPEPATHVAFLAVSAGLLLLRCRRRFPKQAGA